MVSKKTTVRTCGGGFHRRLIVDGKGHLLGRLAAVVAKKLLQGERVVVVRCEEINISGSLYRQKLKWAEFRRKRMNTNPRKGPFHLRHPSKMFWRVVRGMLPHKTKRGKLSLLRLESYEGIPPKYHAKPRMVIPRCLRSLKLQPGRKYCKVGQLASQVGWKYEKEVEHLETKRKAISEAYYKAKQQKRVLRVKAIAAAKSETAQFDKILQSYGML